MDGEVIVNPMKSKSKRKYESSREHSEGSCERVGKGRLLYVRDLSKRLEPSSSLNLACAKIPRNKKIMKEERVKTVDLYY